MQSDDPGSPEPDGEGDGEPTGAGASPTAQVLVELVEALPRAQQVLLRRLLSHHLGARSVAALRYARLGLLIRLCRQGFNGSENEYEIERRKARTDGEHWPSATALSNAYGHWHMAKWAAQRFAVVGSGGRVPFNLKHAVGRQPAASKLDCLDSVKRARLGLGEWPRTRWEYLSWKQLERRAALLASKPVPRLVGLKAFQHFGGFHAVLHEARREAGE